MRQIILDTETTGLDARTGDRLVEIGCLEMCERKLTGRRFHTYLNPERDMPEGAQAVHGLSSDFLQDKPKFADVAASFLEFVRDAELIIHNASFDLGFLNTELERVSLPRLDGDSGVCAGVTDTLRLAREAHPGRKNSLDALCERYGVDNAGRSLHGALLDAQLLAEVYLAMTRGQESLMMELDAPPAVYTDTTVGQARPVLRVIKAEESELAAHAATLKVIETESRGACLWAKLPSA